MRSRSNYYCSACPVCHGQASRADTSQKLVEFHCSECGSFEIARAAVLTLARKRLSQRLMWLRQVRISKPRLLDDTMVAAFP
jgi:predicted RNA-binding Zn-ribbon protein involved in translation (DUF1610 family)